MPAGLGIVNLSNGVCVIVNALVNFIWGLSVARLNNSEVVRLIDFLESEGEADQSLAVVRAHLVQFGLWSHFNFPKVKKQFFLSSCSSYFYQ